jgi:glutamate carboxypeptidase
VVPGNHEMLSWIDSQRDAMRDRVIRWVDINSYTFNLPGLAKIGAEVEAILGGLGATTEWIDLPAAESIDSRGNIVQQPLGRALRAVKRRDAKRQIFLGIHLDTVYPPDQPFQRAESIDSNTLRGPGVIDAKGGVVVMLAALEAFERSEMAEHIGWEVLLNSDEEIGSPGSAKLFAEIGSRIHTGLVFEPAIGEGNLVDSRKGSGGFTIVVHGKSAHAGRDFWEGRNAVVALAEMVTKINAINDPSGGIIVNVGKIEGGGATNVVPDLAIARINVRVTVPEEERVLRDKLKAIVDQANARDGIRVELHGGLSSPPKPLDGRTRVLLDQILLCAKELGLSISSQSSGGTSDGNKLAAAGMAVIDSMGPRGGKLHSPEEFLFIDSLPERAKLTFKVLERIASDL